MSTRLLSRRTFTLAASIAASTALATGVRSGAGQEASPVTSATPSASPSLGFVSSRIRTVKSPEARAEINGLVISDFAPDVEQLPGFQGYLLADVVDDELASLSILLLEQAGQEAAFNDLAAGFVSGVEATVSSVGTDHWAGDLVLIGRNPSTSATPATTALAPVAGSYVAMRVYTSIPGTDPREFVPEVDTGFMPIVSSIAGFQGYLLHLVDGGFVSISLFDSEESAAESNDKGAAWAAENLPDYTDAPPEIVNATIAYASVPIFG